MTQEVPASLDPRWGQPAPDPPRPVAAPVAPASDSVRARTARWWSAQRGHSSRNAIVFCGLLLAIAITAAATLGQSGAGAPAAPRRRAPRAAPTRPAPKPPPRARLAASVAYENYVAGIEGILQQAAPARTQLTVAVRSVQPTCGPAVAPAEQQVSTVVANRTGLIQQLDALGPAPDPATRAAASLLHQALAASAQADAAYQGWIAARASSGSDTCATDPASAATLASAQAADSSATALKTQFVASFDPLAGQIGLPSWSPSDF